MITPINFFTLYFPYFFIYKNVHTYIVLFVYISVQNLKNEAKKAIIFIQVYMATRLAFLKIFGIENHHINHDINDVDTKTNAMVVEIFGIEFELAEDLY